jgi:predicted DNA-binding transcriptional regulator AlpA
MTVHVTTNPHKRINAAEVCALCGGVSDMSLWRWLNDDAMNFPKPIYIARRRYWREADVIQWLDSRSEAA